MVDNIVKECAVAFDHESADHAKGWADDFRMLREKCPVAWTNRHGGYWVSTGYHDLIKVAQDGAGFSPRKTFDEVTGEAKTGVTIPPLPTPAAIPNEVDSPEWELYRSFLNRHFSPKSAKARQAKCQELTDALIDKVIETGRFDIVEDLANPLPAIMTMDLFGFPLDEWEAFAEPVHKILYTPKESPDFPAIMRGWDWIQERVMEEVEKRRKQPSDDLLSVLANGRPNGELMDNATIWSIAYTVIGGGVDTTTALTSNALLYLSENPDDRQMLIDDRSKIPIAREEFLRFFSPVHGMARTATEDRTVGGTEIRAGERVYIAFAAANRDPTVFENPDRLDVTRFPNRHVGFGAGMHRCLGSFLARMMFETMLNAVLTRMPDYVADVTGAERYPSVGTINGWIAIPATFTPGPKIGAVAL